MIIWLNGTFGCGKTSTAAELHSLVPSSRVFDPETVGYMLQPNLADQPVSDFQHWPPWRPLVVATATELARFTGQHLIAPQTILVRAYLEQIFAGLRDAGLDVFHVVLDASEEVLRQRIQGSAEARAWRLDHLAEYRSSRMDDPGSRPWRGYRLPDPRGSAMAVSIPLSGLAEPEAGGGIRTAILAGMDITGLGWCGTRTEQDQQLANFYEYVLGLRPVHAEPGLRVFELPDGHHVEVFSPLYPGRNHFDSGPVVGFAVRDLPAAVEELRSAGIELLGEPGPTWQHFRGPDGNVYELEAS